MYVHGNHVWHLRGVAGTSHYSASQIHYERGREDVTAKKQTSHTLFVSGLPYCTVPCGVKYYLSLSLTVSFSLQVFSIVGRQMGASVTRKGGLWSQWRLGTLWGIWVVAVLVIVRDEEEGTGRAVRAGACQICRLLLALIWRGSSGNDQSPG